MDILKPLADELAKHLFPLLVSELDRQNHRMTGALANSLDVQVVGEKINFLMLDYGLSLNYGVRPERIPYQEGSGKKESEYIKGLIRFAKLKLNLTGDKAINAAFNIARKQKLKGAPLTGKIGWIDKTLAKESDNIDAIIENFLLNGIQQILYLYVDNIQP